MCKVDGCDLTIHASPGPGTSAVRVGENGKCPHHQLKLSNTKRSNGGQRSRCYSIETRKREHKTPRLMVELANEKSQHKDSLVL